MSAETVYQGAVAAALTALGLRVYDFAPQVADGGSAATYPYVEIGLIIAPAWDTKTEDGFALVHRIHSYGRSGGNLDVRLMQGQIYGRLHHGALTLPGYSQTPE